jgi:glycerol-3-phosphate dehydrogenase (NAD(P)+)
MDVAVIGAGSWGSALAKVLVDRGHAVTMWDRNAENLAQIAADKENARYLPGVRLEVRTEPDLARAVAGRPYVLAVVPSHAMREVMSRAAPALAPDAIVISASKGIENQTLATMDEVLKEVLPGRVGARLAFLSGPSFAKEVGQGLPTAVVMASRDRHVAEQAAELFRAERFRIYTSDDVAGVELGGALKNVMAIAAGVADGLGLGSNSRAALITRGLAEITRLGVRKAANPLTFAGLAGLGDLVLTCTGDLSRNRTVGMALGRGQKLKDVLAGMSQVAEGVKTTKSAHGLAQRLGVEMPITDAMYKMLYEDLPAIEAVTGLLLRAPKHELA